MKAELGNIEFTFERTGQGEYLGDCYWEFCDQAIADIEEKLKDVDRHDADLGGYLAGFDEMLEFSQDGTSDTDLALYLTAVLIEIGCHYKVTYSSEHVIWMFHDMQHAVCDTFTDFGVSIEDYSEERAIYKSIELLLENHISIPYDILARTDEEYSARFGYTSDFVGYAEHMEDNSSISGKLLTLKALL